MAKKNKKTSQERVKWHHEDLVELLAWLDHTIEHDDINFSNTAVDHLKESREKDFTIAQIENKLRALWDEYGTNDLPRRGIKWRDHVFVHGSSSIVGLGTDEKEDVASRLQALEEHYEASHLFPSQRLRRRSRPVNVESRRHTSSECLGTPRNKTPRQSRTRSRTLSLTPTAVKRETETAEKGFPQKAVPRKRKRAAPSPNSTLLTWVGQNSQSASLERNESQEQASQVTAAQSGLIIRDSEEEEPRSRCVSLVAENFGHFEVDPFLSDELRDEHRLNGKDGTPSQISEANLTAAKAKIVDLQGQLQQKEAEIRELQSSTVTLQAEVEFLQSVQSQRDMEDGEPLHARIEEKDRTIKRLREELNDRQSLGTFTRLLSASQNWSGDDSAAADVVIGFEYIYFECKQILYRYKSIPAVTIPPLDQYGSLRSLISNGLGLDPHIPLRIEKTVIDLSTLSLQVVIRALTTTALREWVFETNFPTFGAEVSNVLSKYREHLSRQDGANSLRKLDLAVQDSLIKDENFRRSIPEKAEKLAVRLSEILSPLFTRNYGAAPETSWDGFPTWAQETEEYEERRVRLVDIFRRALEVKADSVLNLLDYEMVMFPPQTKYDKNTMVVETMDGMIDYREHSDRKIELCIEAAVYAYPRKELEDSAPISDAIITSTNFLRREGRTRSHVRPIVRAVVILKEE